MKNRSGNWKALGVLLGLSLTLGLAACGNKEVSTVPSVTETEENINDIQASSATE